jgi:hypothetical protein
MAPATAMRMRMTTPDEPADRPDLAAWRRRHELRRSGAAQPIPSGKQYERKPKTEKERGRRDE